MRASILVAVVLVLATFAGMLVAAPPGAPSAASAWRAQDRQQEQQQRRGRQRGTRRENGQRQNEQQKDEQDGKDEKGTAVASDDATKEKESEKEEKITLERLFPEKGLFGPGASRASVSRSGRYGAFLWRPYAERRHGSDLWIHDFETGETVRVTSVSVMSDFQDETRKVRDDRVKKAKKREAQRSARADKGEGTGGKKGQKDAKPAVDPITGTWEGVAESDEAETLPPGGLPVTMELRLAEDGSVSGTVRGGSISAIVSEGKFDRDSGTLSFLVRSEDGELMASVELKLADGELSGTAHMEADGAILQLKASRTIVGEESGNGNGGDGEGTDSAAKRKSAQGEQGTDGNAKKEGAGKDEEEGESKEQAKKTDKRSLGDTVDDKDADDEKAPRYAGIQSIEWAPKKDQLIFTSLGDLYLLEFPSSTITRLTRSREDERDVQFLPDGSGYTYRRGEDLLRVTFGSHLIEQLNPRLSGGERMTGYRISPDGHRLVFLADKGGERGGGRQVNIVNYRDRFAQVNQVQRQMPDDPLPVVESSIYLYELDGLESERGELKKVYSRTRTGPRDVMPVPEWSPDSSRVAFAVFEQSTGIVEILEASFVERKEDEKADGKEKKEGEDAPGAADGKADQEEEDTGEDEKKGDTKRGGDGKDAATAAASAADEPDPKSPWEITDAKAVYRLFHNGGPNTPGLIRPIYLDDSRRMVFLTELSGFRQLHVLDPTYEQLEQLTRGRFEVYPLGVSEDHRRIFALASKDDPTQQQLFRIELETGEMTRLSALDGFYDNAAVSDDGTRALATFADFGSLPELHAIDAGKDKWTAVTSSHPDEARKLTTAKPEYFTYENRHGQTIHGHMFKPDDWTPADKRPLLVYVYGGPLGRRNQLSRGSFSSASYFFAWYMAKVHGYVTCTIDPRGTSGYGGLFEKSNYEQVGKPQVEDLVDGVKWLVEHAGVDAKRVGIHGWSFGGFQTQMCMYTEPEVFAVGIAGAGPTEWENYNAWYSTGTIGPSRTGQTDLSKFSLLPLAKKLKGRLLLIHGVEDSNVLYQDTVRVYRELLKAGKESLVDLFIDPTGGHGLGGDVKTVGRYRKYEDFLMTHLKAGEAAPAPAAEPAVEPPAEEAEAASSKADATVRNDADDAGKAEKKVEKREREVENDGGDGGKREESGSSPSRR